MSKVLAKGEWSDRKAHRSENGKGRADRAPATASRFTSPPTLSDRSPGRERMASGLRSVSVARLGG